MKKVHLSISILEGKGTWTIEDVKYDVGARDVVIVPSEKDFILRII